MNDARTPPLAPKKPITREHHGDVFIDDYEWLREKDGADTVAYLEAENAYTAAQTAHLAPLRAAIFDEIKARTQETDLSVPNRRGPYWYYSRTAEGQQYPLVCRTPASGDDWTPPDLVAGQPVVGEQLLVDCNELAAGHDFFSLGALSVSPDTQLLAFSTDTTGDERYLLQVKDLRTDELLPDTIANTYASATWSPDGRFLFYATFDDSWRLDKVWRHQVGTDSATDVLVHHELDGRFWASIGRTTSDRFLILGIGSKVTSEARILDAADPTGEFRVVVPRETGVEYDVDHAVIGGEDRLLVLHNKDAENFTLGVGSVSLSSLAELTPVIEHDADVRLNDFSVSSSTLAVNLRESTLPQVRVFAITSSGLGAGANISFDEPMFEAYAGGFSDWAQPFVRLGYTSWLTPSSVFDYHPATGERHLRKQQPVLGGYDPADYVQTREWVSAADGARIPISIVHRKDVAPRSGSATLLYGYGAYETSYDPGMSIARLSLLDRGVVYVTAHVRGGGEMGRHWYEDGKGLQKKNTFTDFIACARHLIDTGWTSRGQLVAQGASAGGLLAGVVANEAPELFAGIVAQVPFVDALTTILDPSLPLTEIEWDEWGDPLHDPAVYAYMKSYAPYENVSDLDYPAIYAITSIHDTRVYYVEPAKWIARLRATASSHAHILFKCEMSAGHGGASGRYDAWRETADYFAWVIETAGATQD